MRKLKDKNRSRLIQAAMGKIPCDLTVKNVQYFNVFTGEIDPAEVDVLDGFVVRVRQVGEHSEMPAKSVYDGQGRYLIPGYIDTHMHVESTMMIPEKLSRAILPWGTTTICTDDVHAKDLLTVGHINKVVRKAVQAGISGCEAIKLATFNAAREYGFDDLGAVAPGYIADMQIVDTLDDCQPAAVFVEGRLAAENGAYTGLDHKEGDYDFPNTVNIPQIHSADDFRLKAPTSGDTVKIQVIVPRDGNRVLRDTQVMELPVKDGYVDISGHPDLVYVTVINRCGTGTQTTAIYKYFGLNRGALASTISHDSHNLTVAYRDPKDAYLAAGTLRECAGGVCIVDNGEATTLPLPVAGLMSQIVCADVAAQIEAVQKKLDTMTDGTVTLLATAIMALPVLPGVIITDRGLVDGLSQQFIEQFEG